MVDKYPHKCECGSAFMTDTLLAAHREKMTCKPNQVYTLKVTVKPRLQKKTSSTKCPTCEGKGYQVIGRSKDGSRGLITRLCPQNCVPPKDEDEAFIRNAWAQVGTGKSGTYP